MNYEFCAQTHPGLLRDNNEDAVAFDDSCGLAILADGMGGYNAGEIASSMAIQVIRDELVRWLTGAGAHPSSKELRRALDASVIKANAEVLAAARGNASYAGMGTTLVVAIFLDARLLVGHIGDSRCYRLRQQQLVQITRDHSLLQEQVDAGLITPEQAAVSVHRNLVTRALGIDDAVLLEINEFTVEPGDIYLLCSDGLSDMVEDETIAAVLASTDALDDKARQLVAVANEHGGRDNITVLLAQSQSGARKRSLMARLLRTP